MYVFEEWRFLKILKDKYIQKFSHLHTAGNKKYWNEDTTFKAPNKPLLLLSVIDLIQEGMISPELIQLTPDLCDIFARYWSLCMSPHRRGDIALPFLHLQSEGFWHLIPQQGKEEILANIKEPNSITNLKNLALGARFDKELSILVTDPISRDDLRLALIRTYFSPPIQKKILEQSHINSQALKYSEELLSFKRVASPKPEECKEEVFRDQGFRRAVVTAYNHRCALCGIRMQTSQGHTAVDAAHIIPWSESHNDDPRNGLALCKLCHWAFDEGLMSVSGKYQVITSPQISITPNFPAHLQTLSGRGIILPEKEVYNPDQESLKWHRTKVYKRI